MFIYSDLENTSIDILHKGFITAFSDYQVKLDISFSNFQNMLIRRGFNNYISQYEMILDLK